MLLEMEAVVCLSEPQQDRKLIMQNVTGRNSSNLKTETSAIQTAIAYIVKIKLQKTVILTNPKVDLPSLPIL